MRARSGWRSVLFKLVPQLFSTQVPVCAIDSGTNRHYLELLRCGAGSRLVELAPEEIQASGDHEILNWIIALGIIGDTAAEIVDVRESPTQLAFRVAAIWE
jgi:hypothetical protein